MIRCGASVPVAELIGKEHAEKLAKRTLPGLRVALDPTAHTGFSEFDSLYRDVEALGEIADAR